MSKHRSHPASSRPSVSSSHLFDDFGPDAFLSFDRKPCELPGEERLDPAHELPTRVGIDFGGVISSGVMAGEGDGPGADAARSSEDTKGFFGPRRAPTGD